MQLYVSTRSSKIERAPKELEAFTKVSLAPGETRTVRLAVPAIEFATTTLRKAGLSSREITRSSSVGTHSTTMQCGAPFVVG